VLAIDCPSRHWTFEQIGTRHEVPGLGDNHSVTHDEIG